MEGSRLLAPDPLSPQAWASRGGPATTETASARHKLSFSPIKPSAARRSMAHSAHSPVDDDREERAPNEDDDDDGSGVDALELGRKKLVVPIKLSNGGGGGGSGKRRGSGLLLTSLSPRAPPSSASVMSAPTARSSTASSARDKLTVTAVIVHLLKGNIGPGAMSLPSGFSKTGTHAAPLYFVLVALLSTYNMDLLLYCKRAVSPTRSMSFGEVAGKILGPRGKTLVDVFLVGTQLGICCVYFTFIATNIHVVLPDDLQLVIHERQLIFAIFPVILLLSWIRKLHSITPYSSLANVAVLLGISIVFYYSIDYYNHPTKPRVPPVEIDVSQFPEFYGTAVYSFEGIGLILPIQNEMRNPHLFPRVLAACMLAILVLFLFIGEVPTIAFGRITNGSMTAVLHEYCEGWLVTLANVMLAFACLLSFPIQFYPAVTVLEKAMSKRRGGATPSSRRSALDDPSRRESVRLVEAAGNRRRASMSTASMNKSLAVSMAVASAGSGRRSVTSGSRPTSPAVASATGNPSGLPRWLESLMCSLSQTECNRTIFRSMLCTGLMVVAVCIPDISLLISLFGAVGSSMLAIIVPPVMYLKLHSEHDPLPLASVVVHRGIIVFGVLGMIAGTFQAMRDIVATFQSP